jgi:hypothetical protein
MRELNNKIRNNIANAYYLRNIVKDEKIDPTRKDEIFNYLEELNKKILFYKKLNSVIKEMENDNRSIQSHRR